jgi:hypothetical protein
MNSAFNPWPNDVPACRRPRAAPARLLRLHVVSSPACGYTSVRASPSNSHACVMNEPSQSVRAAMGIHRSKAFAELRECEQSVVDHGEDQVVAGGEVSVQGAGSHACCLGDVTEFVGTPLGDAAARARTVELLAEPSTARERAGSR